MATQTYKPGDFLEDGRQVVEVDEQGRPTVVRKIKKAPEPQPEPEPTAPPEPTTEGDTVEAEPPTPQPKPKAKAKAKAPTKPKASKKQMPDPSVVAEKLGAATKQEPVEETTEDPDMAKSKKQTKKTKPATPKAKAKSTSPRGNKWSPEVKAKFAADIKAGKTTYAAIAKDLGITPQTVWASLNRKKKPSAKKK